MQKLSKRGGEISSPSPLNAATKYIIKFTFKRALLKYTRFQWQTICMYLLENVKYSEDQFKSYSYLHYKLNLWAHECDYFMMLFIICDRAWEKGPLQ